MSRADVDSLPRQLRALVGGIHGAIEYGASLRPAESSDLYLPRQALERLPSLVAYVPDALGPVRLRVVDDDVWHLIPPGRLAPRAAVALDLLDSADPRHWVAAEQLIAHV
jgi:hypothetical protein